jgi:hypothetical protein
MDEIVLIEYLQCPARDAAPDQLSVKVDASFAIIKVNAMDFKMPKQYTLWQPLIRLFDFTQ